MKSRKLIGMREYVFELCRDRSFETRDSAFGTLVENYAKFLSMTLTIELLYELFSNITQAQAIWFMNTYSTVEDLGFITNTLTPLYLNEDVITKYQI